MAGFAGLTLLCYTGYTSIKKRGHVTDADTAEDVYAVIGTVVAILLKPDQQLTLHEIINALHNMGRNTETQEIGYACDEAIKLLARRMH